MQKKKNSVTMSVEPRSVITWSVSCAQAVAILFCWSVCGRGSTLLSISELAKATEVMEKLVRVCVMQQASPRSMVALLNGF
jgi:hypothetical protein